MSAVVRSELWEVVGRLNELGLKMGPLCDAVRRGYIASADCTDNHPPLVRGILGWGEIVVALRESLLAEGWTRSDENNYSIVISPDRRVAIAVATGDEATGNPKLFATTRSLKGPHTIAAVVYNQLQQSLDLFPAPRIQERVEAVQESRSTYLLLVYRAENELRCELSLPDQISDEGRINGWRERIILNPIPLDGEPMEVTPPSQPDLDIQIKRRAS